MSTFLSVDLDFFINRYIPNDTPYNISKFLTQINNTGVTPKVFWEHDEMLPYINESKCTKIINVDFHSDVCLEPARLTEGSFFWYVENREQIDYVWRYPDLYACIKSGAGFCDYREHTGNAYLPNIFKTTKRKLGLTGIPWAHISHIGISISPNWIESDLLLQEFAGVYHWADKATQDKIDTFFNWELKWT